MKTFKGFAILLIILVLGSVLIEREVWPSQISENDIFMLVDKVDSNNLLDSLNYLTSFNSRASYEVQEEVIGFLADQLENAGAIIWLHDYEYDGQTYFPNPLPI